MANIYSWASRVVVWLGLPSSNSSLAMTTLQYLGQQLETTIDGYRLRSPQSPEPDRFWSWRGLPYSAETWEAIFQLLTRLLFSRLWVYQEMQLANSTRTLIQCGHDEVLWYHFRRESLSWLLEWYIACLRTIRSSRCARSDWSNMWDCSHTRRTSGFTWWARDRILQVYRCYKKMGTSGSENWNLCYGRDFAWCIYICYLLGMTKERAPRLLVSTLKEWSTMLLSNVEEPANSTAIQALSDKFGGGSSSSSRWTNLCHDF
jgi:hypothetical protein